MKPFQIIVLAIFVIGAIFGVIVFATTSGFSVQQKIGAVHIWGTLPEGAMNDTLEHLNQTQKQFKDVTYTYVPLAKFDTAVADALAGGSGPDVLILSQEQLLSNRNKIAILPLGVVSKRTFSDTYPKVAQFFFTDAGAYALPLVIDPLMLYFNRTELANVGFASAPTSWEAVAALAPKLTRLDGAQNVTQSAIAFGWYENIENARAVLSLLFLQAGSPVTSVSNGVLRSAIFTQEGSALESAVNYYTQFANPSKTIYSWNRSLALDQQAFIAGSLSLYFGFASERAFLAEANPNLDFDMAKVPQGSTGALRATYAHAYGLALTKASGNPTGGLAVIQALSAPEEQAFLADKLGVAPANNQLLQQGSDDLYGALYYPEALVATAWLSPSIAQTDILLSGMIQNILTGRMSVVEALTNAHQSLNTLLPQ